MRIYFFARYGSVVVAFLGWIAYQLLIKKRTWKDVKSDAFVISIYCVIVMGIFYFAF